MTPPPIPHRQQSNPGTSEDVEKIEHPPEAFPVVAIGASAGGLEAFTALLAHLPADTGMTFVLIQHLAPRHESMLAHLLSRATAMPVNEIEDGTILSPNQVYVIPPNFIMTISDLVLRLSPRGIAGPQTAIDSFLRSLATSHKGGAVAVILSGTGSDGALGVQAIREQGGVSFAQYPQSAKFDGMPRSAIATGCIDFILPPKRIAEELARIASEPHLVHRGTAEVEAQSGNSEKDFRTILDMLRAGTDIDFSLYRQATVRRRILRRVALFRLKSWADYVQHLKENPGELPALAQNILIRVTRFFRDPVAFELLSQRVFPNLIRRAPPDRAVRIWVPGCSTGEEAYSIAICFLEVAEQMHSRVLLQVFATDVNEAAIDKARRGAFIENIAADVSPERLGRFFVPMGRAFHVGKSVRDLCVFSRHDLLKDPPFSRMDLISCRNVLIYLHSMQSRSLSLFHFSLNPEGYLLLGKSENADSSLELFAPVDKEARLYVRQDGIKYRAPAYSVRRRSLSLHAAEQSGEPRHHPLSIIDLRNEDDQTAVEGDGPPPGSINEDLEAREEVVSENEELQSLNEELESSKEELEAANEELESSKEELEATNEELTSVNQELQVRNAELADAREFAQATIDTVRGSLLVLGPDLRVVNANKSFYRTFQLVPEEVEHRFIYELGHGHWSIPRLRLLLDEILPKDRAMEDFEMEYAVPSAGRRTLLLNARRFEREERILLAIEDVTESKRLDEDLRQSQKMEAIGHLASGVAHDFNNLLTGMIGNASLLLEGLPQEDTRRSLVEQVIIGGQHAADLTRQLLAYAGKGRFYLERLDLSEVVIQTSRLIHTSVPPNVQLRLDLDRHLPLLLADPGQMQQVVMNLVINAAEAIGNVRGSVLVRTGRQTVTDEPLPDLYMNDKVTPGDYVFLEVQDTGSGMDEQTKRRIFDPFFTTKFQGRGLGLAAVLGIVRHHKGVVQVHSVPGRGSTFTVLFSAAEEVSPKVAESEIREHLRGTGTVLVVDDEEVIRNFSRSALEAYGYTVHLAGDGQEAVRLFQEKCKDIALILLDVAMPGMDGLETLEQIRAIRPDIPVIVCSGFGDEDVETRFAGKNVAGFCPKPYTVRQLARKIKECMPS